MPQPRAADDFETIHARMEELRRERRPTPSSPAARRAAPRPSRPLRLRHELFSPDECDGYCKAL